jgi:hypothetical protein
MGYSNMVTSQQAADVLGCAESTLRKSRVTGRLFSVPAPPHRKLGKKVVYDPAALLDWIDRYFPEQQ